MIIAILIVSVTIIFNNVVRLVSLLIDCLNRRNIDMVRTYKAVTKLKEGVLVEAEARGFKLLIDEPIDQEGTDKGMTPVELLLCSLGSCQTIMATLLAPEVGVNLENVWVELEGEIDSDGSAGLTDVRPGFLDIRFNFHVKSDASEEKIKDLIELVEARCPVGDTIGQGVKLNRTKITIEK